MQDGIGMPSATKSGIFFRRQILLLHREFINKIEISWDGFSGSDYYVYRSTNNAAESSIEISGRLQLTNFVDTTAITETLYYYWLKTAVGDDKSGFSDPATGWVQIPEPVGIWIIGILVPLIKGGTRQGGGF